MSNVIIITPNKDGLEGNRPPAAGWLNLPEKETKNKIRKNNQNMAFRSKANEAEESALCILVFSCKHQPVFAAKTH